MACSRGVFTRDTSDLSLVFLAFPRMPVDFLTNDRAGATLRPLRRRAPTPRTSSVFPHWLHEFINMYRRYYFGLTEEVHRGELRALREPARRNSGAVIAPARRENTRFSFHCYSDPPSPGPSSPSTPRQRETRGSWAWRSWRGEPDSPCRATAARISTHSGAIPFATRSPGRDVPM